MLEWHNSTAIPEDAMARDEYLFTSESVTEGHPDKIADQISDAVLDAIIGQDPTGRVACECLLTTGLVVVAGEITTSCYVDIPRIARDTIRDVGYTRAKFGFDHETCAVITAIEPGKSKVVSTALPPPCPSLSGEGSGANLRPRLSPPSRGRSRRRRGAHGPPPSRRGRPMPRRGRGSAE